MVSRERSCATSAAAVESPLSMGLHAGRPQRAWVCGRRPGVVTACCSAGAPRRIAPCPPGLVWAELGWAGRVRVCRFFTDSLHASRLPPQLLQLDGQLAAFAEQLAPYSRGAAAACLAAQEGSLAGARTGAACCTACCCSALTHLHCSAPVLLPRPPAAGALPTAAAPGALLCPHAGRLTSARPAARPPQQPARPCAPAEPAGGAPHVLGYSACFTFRLPSPAELAASSRGPDDDDDTFGLWIEEWDQDSPWRPWAAQVGGAARKATHPWRRPQHSPGASR
jgi:hypothetical protein